MLNSTITNGRIAKIAVWVRIILMGPDMLWLNGRPLSVVRTSSDILKQDPSQKPKKQ
jgi:hypothetical protein